MDSEPEVMRFVTDGITRERKHQVEAVPRVIKYMEQNPGPGLWIGYLKDTNEFMGWYILKHLPDDGEVEVDFRLKKKFWAKVILPKQGNGYSNMALKHLG